LQVPAKNVQSTQVEGENVQIFKDLKIAMDKYVLHSNFYAMDMDEVDIVLGYPWIESVGTININVQKKFLKLWYKKKKITLQDVSLSKKYGPMVASKEVIVESEVESEAESTEGDEAKPQEGHNNEAKEVIDSKAQCVTDLKKKEHIPIVVVYLHPHHIEKQQSSRQGHDLQHIYAPVGHQKGNQSRGAWRTMTLQEDIRLAKQSHGNTSMMQIKIRWQGNSWTSCSSSIRMDGWSYLVPVGYIA
jgi:hypothetical protein